MRVVGKMKRTVYVHESIPRVKIETKVKVCKMEASTSSASSGANLYLTKEDFEMNDTKHKVDQKNFVSGKGEEMEKRKENEQEESMLTLKSNNPLQLSIPLIRRPSEEGFHQVVKFTKHITRRPETELPERNSVILTESSKQEKSSSKTEDISVIQSQCYDSADKICTSKPASASNNNHFSNSDIIELKPLSDESICTKRKETSETMNLIEADELSKLQQKDDGEEICQELCHLQTDKSEKSKTNIIIKEQQKLLNGNRTFIINDPQHCSVSATLSLSKPKKLFINKGKINERSIASATFQVPITVISHQQNLNDSKEDSTSANNKIDQKSTIANFKTEAISTSGNYRLQDSSIINNNNDSISLTSQQKCSNSSYYSVPINNPETISIAKHSDTATTEVTVDVPRPDSPHSLNSRESAGYCGDCSSVNSLHSTDYKDGMNRRQNNNNEFRESLSSRLSRGFLEFTQGSSDRLQKWKNKLQNGRRHKDSSEPPPINRKMLASNQEQSGHLSDVEVALDWATLKSDSTDQIHNMNVKLPSKGSAFALKVNQPRSMLQARSVSDLFLTNGNTTRGHEEDSKIQIEKKDQYCLLLKE
ncbi:hypothetical protein DINM_020135 [Dirofilaria immitis]|nr:hypothetical protein [Dirofilaria immitis]